MPNFTAGIGHDEDRDGRVGGDRFDGRDNDGDGHVDEDDLYASEWDNTFIHELAHAWGINYWPSWLTEGIAGTVRLIVPMLEELRRISPRNIKSFSSSFRLLLAHI